MDKEIVEGQEMPEETQQPLSGVSKSTQEEPSQFDPWVTQHKINSQVNNTIKAQMYNSRHLLRTVAALEQAVFAIQQKLTTCVVEKKGGDAIGQD